MENQFKSNRNFKPFLDIRDPELTLYDKAIISTVRRNIKEGIQAIKSSRRMHKNESADSDCFLHYGNDILAGKNFLLSEEALHNLESLHRGNTGLGKKFGKAADKISKLKFFIPVNFKDI